MIVTQMIIIIKSQPQKVKRKRIRNKKKVKLFNNFDEFVFYNKNILKNQILITANF